MLDGALHLDSSKNVKLDVNSESRLGTVSDQLCSFLGSVHSVRTARSLHEVHVNEGVNVAAETTVNSCIRRLKFWCTEHLCSLEKKCDRSTCLFFWTERERESVYVTARFL